MQHHVLRLSHCFLLYEWNHLNTTMKEWLQEILRNSCCISTTSHTRVLNKLAEKPRLHTIDNRIIFLVYYVDSGVQILVANKSAYESNIGKHVMIHSVCNVSLAKDKKTLQTDNKLNILLSF